MIKISIAHQRAALLLFAILRLSVISRIYVVRLFHFSKENQNFPPSAAYDHDDCNENWKKEEALLLLLSKKSLACPSHSCRPYLHLAPRYPPLCRLVGLLSNFAFFVFFWRSWIFVKLF